MKKGILLCILLAISSSYGFVRWGTLYWANSLPDLYTNTSTPANLRPEVLRSADAIRWSGSAMYPYHRGTTGRDCGSGDSWFSDDDDGYNVVDYWTKCNGGHSMDCNSANAVTHVIDVYNTQTDRFAEVDIVMCSNKVWTDSYFPSESSLSYQGALTHELGHFMGLSHSDVSTANQATMHTSAQLGNVGAYARQSMSFDDVAGLRSIYGSCAYNGWTVSQAAGHLVSTSAGDDCGVNLSLFPRGTGNAWTTPVVAEQNQLGGWIYNNTFAEWQEFDKDHSLIITLMVVGTDGVTRELNYARNASNWWANQGWVSMTAPAGYNTWTSVSQNIGQDYINEYGSGLTAWYVSKVYAKHFAYTGWNQSTDHGGSIRNLRIQRK